MTTHDPVNHPQHYTSHPSGVECITITEHFNFCLGNALKYIWRSEMTTPDFQIQDLQKARWYLDREIARLTKMRGGDVAANPTPSSSQPRDPRISATELKRRQLVFGSGDRCQISLPELLTQSQRPDRSSQQT